MAGPDEKSTTASTEKRAGQSKPAASSVPVRDSDKQPLIRDWRWIATMVVAIIAAIGSVVGGVSTCSSVKLTNQYVELTRQLVRKATDPILTIDSARVRTDDPAKKLVTFQFVIVNRGSGPAYTSVTGLSSTVAGQPVQPTPNIPKVQTLVPGTPISYDLVLAGREYDAFHADALIEVTVELSYTGSADSEPRSYRWRGIHRHSDQTVDFNTLESR